MAANTHGCVDQNCGSTIFLHSCNSLTYKELMIFFSKESTLRSKVYFKVPCSLCSLMSCASHTQWLVILKKKRCDVIEYFRTMFSLILRTWKAFTIQINYLRMVIWALYQIQLIEVWWVTPIVIFSEPGLRSIWLKGNISLDEQEVGLWRPYCS